VTWGILGDFTDLVELLENWPMGYRLLTECRGKRDDKQVRFAHVSLQCDGGYRRLALHARDALHCQTLAIEKVRTRAD
jgi:hypothetical protein